MSFLYKFSIHFIVLHIAPSLANQAGLYSYIVIIDIRNGYVNKDYVAGLSGQ